MVKRDAKSPKRKVVRLKNALDSASLSSCLRSLAPDVLAQFMHDLRIRLYYWMGDPTEDRIRNFEKPSLFWISSSTSMRYSSASDAWMTSSVACSEWPWGSFSQSAEGARGDRPCVLRTAPRG